MVVAAVSFFFVVVVKLAFPLLGGVLFAVAAVVLVAADVFCWSVARLCAGRGFGGWTSSFFLHSFVLVLRCERESGRSLILS